MFAAQVSLGNTVYLNVLLLCLDQCFSLKLHYTIVLNALLTIVIAAVKLVKIIVMIISILHCSNTNTQSVYFSCDFTHFVTPLMYFIFVIVYRMCI